MNFKLPFILLVIGVGVAGVIPFGISQQGGVEPSMEIDMISGQTQNPFRIQDSQNNNVFTVDTDGHVTPEHQWREMNYNRIELLPNIANLEAELPTDKTFAHDSVLAQWEFTGNERELFLTMRTDQTNGFIEFVRVSGTGICIIQAQEYSFGGWGNYAGQSLGGTATIWTPDDTIDVNANYADLEAYRIIAFVTNADTECDFRYLSLTSTIHVPPDITLTRVK